MRRAFRMSTFGSLSEKERRQAVAELSAAAHGPPNGEIVSLQAEIRAFERRYEITSSQMEAMVKDGRMPENADVCRWLMSLGALRLVSGAEARP